VTLAGVRIKPRAQREIERAAGWWAKNRHAAPGAVRKDVEAAVDLLAQEPGIGIRVEAPRRDHAKALSPSQRVRQAGMAIGCAKRRC
jgi:plasmid stabilization system protein ParE